MKFAMKIYQEFEADTGEAAQEFVIAQIKDGMKQTAAIELIQLPTEEEKEAAQSISFEDMLKNLNSSDMTKN